MSQSPFSVWKYRVHMFCLFFALLLFGCSGANMPSLTTGPAVDAVATAILAPISPSNPDLPGYPNQFGVPAAGIYQEPTTGVSPYAWIDFPAYPDNIKLNPATDQDVANCDVDASGWTACSYAFGWQVALRSPSGSLAVLISPSNADGYMIIASSMDGGATFATNESKSLVFSDGTSIASIRMTVTWSATAMYSYQFGFFSPP